MRCQSFSGKNEGGVSSSADGSSSAIEEQRNEGHFGQLIGPVKDASGSIVSFNLYSQSGLYPFLLVSVIPFAFLFLPIHEFYKII